MTALDLTLLYLLAAVVGVVAFRSLKLPPMLGYLSVGVVIGPHMLGWANQSEAVQHLAEFGVVFLMFVIGLEFNLPKLKTMRRHVWGLGFLQVACTLLLVWAMAGVWMWCQQLWAASDSTASYFVLEWLSHLPTLSWKTALALASALAMSSTAIVVKLMTERLEVDSEHGKRVMGVLLFQDLAVVPLLVLIPALATDTEQLGSALLFAGIKAAALIGLLLAGGQKIMRWWLTQVVKHKSAELFVLNLLFITLGLAWLTQMAGLSMALGAFIAGMLISETEFKHDVENDIRPFHDVLLGLFFITVGMMLDAQLVWQKWPLVLLMFLLPVLFKLILVTVLAKWLGATTGVALRTGIYLAQAGEFGFVLLTLANTPTTYNAARLVPDVLFNPILAGMVLSMLATPFMVMGSDTLVRRWVGSDWLQQSLKITGIASQSIKNHNHVIICGYGRCGQNLARLLESENIPYLALDLDPEHVQHAVAAGENVVYGDAMRLQTLVAAGLIRASAVVVTYLDTASAFKILHNTHNHAPKVPVVVRTKDDVDLERLQKAGATEVVPETIEGSLILASHALVLVGIPMRRVIRLVQEQRDARYPLLKEDTESV